MQEAVVAQGVALRASRRAKAPWGNRQCGEGGVQEASAGEEGEQEGKEVGDGGWQGEGPEAGRQERGQYL